MRTCVGCRARVPVSELLRLVVLDGSLTPDPTRRLPGRGAHLHPDPGCLDLALRRRAFPRAFRLPGPLDATGLREHVEESVRSASEANDRKNVKEAGRDTR
jgi:hypothetical protein